MVDHQWASMKSSNTEGTSDLNFRLFFDITAAAKHRKVWYCKALTLQPGISFNISDGFWEWALLISMWAPWDNNRWMIWKMNTRNTILYTKKKISKSDCMTGKFWIDRKVVVCQWTIKLWKEESLSHFLQDQWLGEFGDIWGLMNFIFELHSANSS